MGGGKSPEIPIMSFMRRLDPKAESTSKLSSGIVKGRNFNDHLKYRKGLGKTVVLEFKVAFPKRLCLQKRHRKGMQLKVPTIGK